MANMQQWLDRGRGALTQNYARLPVVMERGGVVDVWSVV